MFQWAAFEARRLKQGLCVSTKHGLCVCECAMGECVVSFPTSERYVSDCNSR